MSAPTLAKILAERREEVVARFVSELQRTHVSPEGIPRSLLVDHIPRFLDEMVRVLGPAEADDAIRASAEAAREHGEQRWSIGYDLAALLREYRLLWKCILGAAKETHEHLPVDEVEECAGYLSAAIDEATLAYTKHRDEEVAAQKAQLEFIADAGQLLSSSLDYRSTLHHLAQLLVPRMADWCAVHLEGTSVEEMPITHVDPSKVEILRELYRHHPLADTPRGYHRVVSTGEPVFVPEVEDDFFASVAKSPEHLALIRVIHSTSWISVPLAVEGNRFGAITLAFSESSRRYTERDLVVASDLARRAAIAIDNARLYQLAQNERSRVEAATRAKDEFVAMVSHELRTPLNAILGWLQIIHSRPLTEEKRAHALAVIERNAHAQSRLVGDLLDISRTLTGTLRINPSQVDFSNVVEMAIEGVRPAAEAKRIRLETRLDAAALMRGDAERLQQVVWNLLVNAVKFTPKGGVVDVALQRVESELVLTVQDNGIGIPADFLPHAFESFRQVDTSTTRRHGGLGVGLSIAKYIVDLHGGTIDASSEGRDRGTTITVHLPISPLVSTTLGVARVPATRPPPTEVALPVARGLIRVLVVDDEADARDLLAYVFEAAGIECQSARSAADAMRALETFVPDVIVSDIGMPEEDGYALIRRIRTLPDARKTIPAIALTAFSRGEDRARALVDGFNEHMAKPVEPARLLKAVLDLAQATIPPGTS